MDYTSYGESPGAKYHGIDIKKINAKNLETGVKYHGVGLVESSLGNFDTSKELNSRSSFENDDTSKEVCEGQTKDSGGSGDKLVGFLKASSTTATPTENLGTTGSSHRQGGSLAIPGDQDLHSDEQRSTFSVAGAPTDKSPSFVQTKPRKWWKWKRVWVSAMAFSVAIIVVVPLARLAAAGWNRSSTNANDASSLDSKSVCSDLKCNQILSTATLGDELHVFALGEDKGIWTRAHGGTSSTGNWFSLGGSFSSQPSSVTWNNSNQINVFALDTSGNSVSTKRYANGQWDQSWLSLRGAGSTAVAACNRKQDDVDRTDIFVRAADGDNGIIHDFWAPEKNEWWGQSSKWDDTPFGSSRSAPAVVCRDDNIYHDLVIYNETKQSVAHNQYQKSAGDWKGWVDLGEHSSGILPLFPLPPHKSTSSGLDLTAHCTTSCGLTLWGIQVLNPLEVH
ncbi:hypothetical protein F5Y15DRAFT_377435 [Xylariaceae sp. FL0016]|nr:hypothetical protein F5Y15DRAFT_377435 [Xylariaceae sp. FL0016]